MSLLPIARLILSSFFKKEATVSYPIEPMKKDALVRGHVGISIEDCIYCGICQRKCPTNAITVKKPDKSWEIERFQCVVCNCCVESCPKKCLHMSNELTPASDYCIKDISKDARVPADA